MISSPCTSTAFNSSIYETVLFITQRTRSQSRTVLKYWQYKRQIYMYSVGFWQRQTITISHPTSLGNVRTRITAIGSKSTIMTMLGRSLLKLLTTINKSGSRFENSTKMPSSYGHRITGRPMFNGTQLFIAGFA